MTMIERKHGFGLSNQLSSIRNQYYKAKAEKSATITLSYWEEQQKLRNKNKLF